MHNKFISFSTFPSNCVYCAFYIMNALLCVQIKLGFYSKAVTSYNRSITTILPKNWRPLSVVMVAGWIGSGGGVYTPKPDTPNNNYSKCQRQNPGVNHGMNRILWKLVERQCHGTKKISLLLYVTREKRVMKRSKWSITIR